MIRFIFQPVEVQPENVVAVNMLIIDPATKAQVEMPGEFVMLKPQWEALKPMLVHGASFFLDGEATIEFREGGVVGG